YDLVFSETCPAYNQDKVDFSAALFPDPSVISDLGKPSYEEQIEEPMSTTEGSQQVAVPSTSLLDKTTIEQDSQINNITDHPQDKRKPLVSFEEWQKKVLQLENDKDRRVKRKSGSIKSGGNKRQQVVDSIDGGFSDDFGSMLEDLIGGVVSKEKKPNVYAEGEYISPSESGSNGKDKKKQPFADARIKSLKERFNYASTDCAATVRKANKQAKGAHSILYESKDQYMLNKCSADKFVIINLCEQIVVDTIVMANFEFFSSTFKDFRVYASSKYPTNEWRLLGQWQARNTRDLQVFKVPDSGFVEYIKIEFLTHYGHEYYCPLSLVRVHGMSMMEYYTTVESQDEGPVLLEEEHLWPAEVREQIIQPQFDITNTSESFPVKNEVDEDEVKIIIPPISLGEAELPALDVDKVEHATETPVDTTAIEDISIPMDTDIPLKSTILSSFSTSHFNIQAEPTHSHVSLQTDKLDKNQSEPDTISTVSSSLANHTVDSSPTLLLIHGTNNTSTFGNSNATTITTSMTSSGSATTPKVVIPNTHTKESGSTQESIYKTIMKRLNVLEVNMTLSQRFLDDQNKILNDVFLDMEKRHQEQLILLIGHLNETASYKIDSMKRRYEQWYEDLKEQTESDMQEMTTKISMLADQLSFERRVSVSQLIIMIILFVFMALSRGTFSTLSPVVAAQQEQRKRRQSIDPSLGLPPKDAFDALLRELEPIKKPTSSQNEPPSIQKQDILLPKKPKNLRRHSDSPYHTMKESDLNIFSSNTVPVLNKQQFTMDDSEELQRKLSQIFIQQQEQTVPHANTISQPPSIEGSCLIKNRKRSSTSPPS
ncbi:hypothetical protein CU098_007582, partial [Rhizopus stolonifer]